MVPRSTARPAIATVLASIRRWRKRAEPFRLRHFSFFAIFRIFIGVIRTTKCCGNRSLACARSKTNSWRVSGAGRYLPSKTPRWFAQLSLPGGYWIKAFEFLDTMGPGIEPAVFARLEGGVTTEQGGRLEDHGV